MNDQNIDSTDKFEKLMQRVLARPLPNDAMARVRILAKELAEGALEELWNSTIFAPYRRRSDEGIEGYHPQDLSIQKYLATRWNNSYPNLQLLKDSGFLSQSDKSNFTLNQVAFDLTQSADNVSSFISYRRKDSSAFALLILKCMKVHGLDAFVDMALIPGEDWHAGLKERIQQYDYLIAILGQETLSSEYVIKEITWALEAELKIIPIWHNGFKYETNKWDLTVEVHECLSRKHAIEVKEESALGYETAIIELLNKNFGITP